MKYIPIKVAAEKAGLTRQIIARWAKEGRILSQPAVRGYLVSLAEVRKYAKTGDNRQARKPKNKSE